MHDVCPCCRCTMITDTEWTFAARHENNDTELRTSGSTEMRLSGDLPETTTRVTTTTADEENAVVPANESHDQEEEHTTNIPNAESLVFEPEPVTSC